MPDVKAKFFNRVAWRLPAESLWRPKGGNRKKLRKMPEELIRDGVQQSSYPLELSTKEMLRLGQDEAESPLNLVPYMVAETNSQWHTPILFERAVQYTLKMSSVSVMIMI